MVVSAYCYPSDWCQQRQVYGGVSILLSFRLVSAETGVCFRSSIGICDIVTCGSHQPCLDTTDCEERSCRAAARQVE